VADDEERENGKELDRREEARRRLALAQVRQYPDAALRLRANEIEDFDDDLRRLADRMIGLMQGAHGVGLAGTQIGVLQRIFVMQPGQDEEARAVVNPEIVERSEETETDTEGCLSLQGVLVPVERSTAVTLVGRDLDGGEIRLELEELPARVAQHELDHLDGVLILDRTTPESRKEALAILRPRLVVG
jgi:peptide deformylase